MRDPVDNSTRDAFSSPGQLSVGLIQHVRKLFGMTQEQFGRLVGLHYVTISNLERKDLALDDELRHKLLMLQEISRVPGAVDMMKYMVKNHSGTDALWVGITLHKVVA